MVTADTWEFHVIKIPGDTTGSAINNDNGIGLHIQFMLAVGSSGTTSVPDAWNASGAARLATANQVNLLDNAANNVRITGVKYEVGSVATPFDHIEEDQELARCAPYYFRLPADEGNAIFGNGRNSSTTISRMSMYLPAAMRTDNPSLETSGTAADYQILNTDGGTTACSVVPNINTFTGNRAEVAFTIGSASLVNDEISGCSGANTNAHLSFEDEL